jgi:hypothetical protein
MGHVEKEMRIQPSIFQIQQRINMFEAVVTKPVNFLFDGNLEEQNQKNKKDHADSVDEVDEEEQKRQQKQNEEFEEKMDALKEEGYDQNLGVTFYSFNKKQQLKSKRRKKKILARKKRRERLR